MSSVPVFEDISFYENTKAQDSRYNQLKKSFNTFFPDEKIDYFARSPGRVNIIGDHIDYNFFPVLPMAINNDVVAAVKLTNDDEIVITNTDKEFTKQVIPLPSDPIEIIKIDAKLSWANYFKCGLIVAQKYLLDNNLLNGKLKGMKILFNGNVPTGGGLSSSAAFCVATTLSILYANGVTNVSKADLTKITVVSEHYVGLNNGGMDQCASIYGESGKALLVQFRPEIKGTPFEFPVKDLVFVITNSLQVANKAETGPIHYNLRVVEMAIGADLLAKKLKLQDVPQDSNLTTSSLRSVMESKFGNWNSDDIDLGIEYLSSMIELVEQHLNPQGYTIEQVSSELDISINEFKLKYLTKFPVRFDTLKIYQRAKHVYRESLRVLETLKLLKSPIDNETHFLKQFGFLLNQSQDDLSNLCENSNEKLDEICKIGLSNGSFGGRITGAGWGGSLVHLTTVDNLSTLINAFTQEYYNKEFPEITKEELEEAILVSKPATGSSIITANFLQQ